MARGVCWSNLQDLEDVPDHEPVYILVFGAGTGSEGLYSLQERTKEDVPVDIILGFPAEEDALRYGTLLEAEMGRVPVVESARPEDLRYTCREGGYRCKVARRGVLLMPPEKTVEVTDWERTNALRQGQWSVDQMAGSGNGGGGSGAAEGKARRESTGAVAEEEGRTRSRSTRPSSTGTAPPRRERKTSSASSRTRTTSSERQEMLARLFDRRSARATTPTEPEKSSAPERRQTTRSALDVFSRGPRVAAEACENGTKAPFFRTRAARRDPPRDGQLLLRRVTAREFHEKKTRVHGV